MRHVPGIGPTHELSLRVSVATLVRVIFRHPGNGEWMLALERKATLRENTVEVKSQPFGGAIRILDLESIHNLIGDFHFDSERSLSEQDFRLFIRPSSWPAVRDFCIEHLSHVGDPFLETDPTRELVEEFEETMRINLISHQYTCIPLATVIENDPAPTENIYARGLLTARAYRIFEAAISDSSLALAIMRNSEGLSYQDLCKIVLDDARNGGKGRANAVLALPLKRVTDAYLALSPEERNVPILFADHRLDETVPAVLDGIEVDKFQRV